MEAVDTMIYCAMRQKRIIDDILAHSRLDANLLVAPKPSQPIPLIRSALKMFESELSRAEIRLDFIEQDTLRDLDVQCTILDPSRVLQVLINLMTNAIQFARTEDHSHIQMIMGASLHKLSTSNDQNLKYVNKSSTNSDQTRKQERGDGEVTYVSITVVDTGRRLTSSKINNLFHLFAQANPKTYQTYGGSGLGLFISEQLVEIQGGEIGVKSESEKGCTFQFYIKTRRAAPGIESKDNKGFQLMMREDVIREACGVEISELQNGTSIPNTELDLAHKMTISTPRLNLFHTLIVEDNLVNQKWSRDS